MSRPPSPRGTRARDTDRQLVVDALSEAHGAGQLTFGELEERSRAASAAVTLQQLDSLTADLQGMPAMPVPQTQPGRSVPPAPVTGPALSPGRRLLRGSVGLSVLAALAVGGMLLADTVAQAFSGLSPLAGDDPRLHTPAGYAELLADAESELGTSEVARAVVYPGYAVLTVPVEGEPRHLQSYYYDGSVDEPSPGGTREPGDPLVDLAAVDGEVVAQLVKQAPKALGVARPTSTYLIVESWGDPVQPALSVYASDDYDSGYLVAATDGHLLDAYPAP